ncbi:MAG: hypothetical protein EOO57_00865, partial [Hymenobacter sp.]
MLYSRISQMQRPPPFTGPKASREIPASRGRVAVGGPAAHKIKSQPGQRLGLAAAQGRQSRRGAICRAIRGVAQRGRARQHWRLWLSFGPASGPTFAFRMTSIKYITTAAQVADVAAHLATLPRIGIDLEFDDNRYRYGRHLALIQVFDGETVYLIDPLPL